MHPQNLLQNFIFNGFCEFRLKGFNGALGKDSKTLGKQKQQPLQTAELFSAWWVLLTPILGRKDSESAVGCSSTHLPSNHSRSGSSWKKVSFVLSSGFNNLISVCKRSPTPLTTPAIIFTKETRRIRTSSWKSFQFLQLYNTTILSIIFSSYFVEPSVQWHRWKG